MVHDTAKRQPMCTDKQDNTQHYEAPKATLAVSTIDHVPLHQEKDQSSTKAGTAEE